MSVENEEALSDLTESTESISNVAGSSVNAIKSTARATKGAAKAAKKTASKTKSGVKKTAAFIHNIVAAIGLPLVSLILIPCMVVAIAAVAFVGGNNNSSSGGGAEYAEGYWEGGDYIDMLMKEKGNGGQKYCNVMFGGSLVDWCAIFVGWSIRQMGGNESAYGYSANVGDFQRGADALGLWHLKNDGYTPKPGDFIIYSGNCHIGIVTKYENGMIDTIEGNTSARGGGIWCYSSIVDTHNYTIDNGYVRGFISTNLNHPSSSRTSGSRSGGRGICNSSYSADKNYKEVKYKLSSQERTYLEHVVSGEFGNDWVGCVLIAQCLKDALVNKQFNDPMKAGRSSSNGGMGYTGWSDTIFSNAKKAVKYVFDEGHYGAQHRLYYMVTEDYYNNNADCWHRTASTGSYRTIKRILQYQNVIFFDRL